MTLRAGQAVELQGAYVALLADGHLVVDVKGAGRVWSSPHPGRVVDPVASFTRDGRLLITDGNRVVWDATASIAAVPPPDRPPLVRTVARLTLSDEAPYISLTDEWSNVRFAAVSRWVPNGFRLGAGCYIALHADVDELARPPTSASPTTWLVLQATDSEIVLHTGVRPFEYAEHDVVWRAGIWRDPKPSADPSIEEGGTSLVFQWDGNLVLCVGLFEHLTDVVGISRRAVVRRGPARRTAVMASSTSCVSRRQHGSDSRRRCTARSSRVALESISSTSAARCSGRPRASELTSCGALVCTLAWTAHASTCFDRPIAPLEQCPLHDQRRSGPGIRRVDNEAELECR